MAAIKITRSQEQLDELMNKVATIIDEGGSTYPGMTYEQGVQAAIDWLEGRDESPL